MGKDEICYLDIYQTPIIGTALAIFHNGQTRDSLDTMLNAHDADIPFSLIGGKAYTLYHRAVQKTGATTLFTQEFFPSHLEKVIKKIESGVEPNETLKLVASTDTTSWPARRKFSIIETTKGEEKPKEILRRIFTIYPVLAIAREDQSNMNQPKNKGIREVYLYDVSEETLRSGYDMGAFEVRDDNGPQKIINKKKDGLLHLYTGHDFKLDAAFRKAKFKANSDPSQELMNQIKLLQEDYAKLKEEYDKTSGTKIEFEKQYKKTLQISVNLATKLAERDKLQREVDEGTIEAEDAERIFGKLTTAQIKRYGDLEIMSGGSADEMANFIKGDHKKSPEEDTDKK